MKEHEEWKSITKEIRVNNIDKIKYIAKIIVKQTESNKELVKTNSNLKDHMQNIKREHEYWKNLWKLALQQIEKLDREWVNKKKE